MSLVVAVRRKIASFAYLRDPAKPFAWDNNDANNSLDTLEVYEASDLSGISGVPVFSCRAQTVSNTEGLIKGARQYRTIAPGTFDLRAFATPRQFYGRIHGVCNARTIGGDWIGVDSEMAGNDNRWLVHDWQKHRDTGPAGRDTRVAWSAGCCVIPDRALEELGILFDHHGISAGDLIPGILQEVA